MMPLEKARPDAYGDENVTSSRCHPGVKDTSRTAGEPPPAPTAMASSPSMKICPDAEGAST